MRYEWDAAKNEANIAKHRLDFADAFRIFQALVSIVLDDRFDYGEGRWIATGLLCDIIVVVVYTEPDADTRRIISLRKATPYERTDYKDFFQNELGLPEDPA